MIRPKDWADKYHASSRQRGSSLLRNNPDQTKASRCHFPHLSRRAGSKDKPPIKQQSQKVLNSQFFPRADTNCLEYQNQFCLERPFGVAFSSRALRARGLVVLRVPLPRTIQTPNLLSCPQRFPQVSTFAGTLRATQPAYTWRPEDPQHSQGLHCIKDRSRLAARHWSGPARPFASPELRVAPASPSGIFEAPLSATNFPINQRT